MAVAVVNESLQGISNAFHMNCMKSVELVTQYMAELGAEDGEAADCLGATLRELVDLLYGVKRKKANPKKKKLAYPTAKDVINHIYNYLPVGANTSVLTALLVFVIVARTPALPVIKPLSLILRRGRVLGCSRSSSSN